MTRTRAIVEAYQARPLEPVDGIARRFGISSEGLYRVLRAAGVQPNRFRAGRAGSAAGTLRARRPVPPVRRPAQPEGLWKLLIRDPDGAIRDPSPGRGVSLDPTRSAWPSYGRR